MQTTDPLAEEERRKYEKMWAREDYRRNSPGLNIAPVVLELWGAGPGASLVDWGCGEGKAVDWFRGQGLSAIGVDLVPLRADIIGGCLWDIGALPSVVSGEFSFCADVMEHVPEGKVAEVLRGIASRTTTAAAFTIASIGCTCGRRAGEALHLTIKPREWWKEELLRYFREVEYHPTDRKWRHLFICRP